MASFQPDGACVTLDLIARSSSVGVLEILLGGVTAFSQVSTSRLCDPNASCLGGGCVCNPGFVGSGTQCTGMSLMVSVAAQLKASGLAGPDWWLTSPHGSVIGGPRHGARAANHAQL